MGSATEATGAGATPLAGIRVLDFTLAMAGPAATQRLADLGAVVLKVEPPASGDFTRTYPIDDTWLGERTTTSFFSLNRNKRSLAIDLKSAAGQALALRLAATCDVLVENFRPGVAERLGIDWDTVHAANPKLVYVSISGYGAEGPLHGRPGQDLLAQAFSGMMWNVGREGEPPHAAPAFVADSIASHLAVEAALAGYLGALRSGEGTRLEVSLLGALLEMQSQELVTFLASGRTPRRSAERVGHTMLAPPYGVYATADGHLALAMGDLGACGEVVEADLVGLEGDRDAIFRAVAERLPAAPTAEWVERFAAAGLWAGPVLGYEELVGHPQVEANGFFVDVEDPSLGTIRCVDTPIFGAAPRPAPAPPPRLGEHTVEVLREIGLDPEEIEAHRKAGAL